MTREEAVERCGQVLRLEMDRYGYITAGKLGRAAGVDSSMIHGYLRGVGLPSRRTWARLRACMPSLPAMCKELGQTTYSTQRVVNPGAGGNDITPIERSRVVANLFGCKPQQLPCYDVLSFWVLDQLNTMPSRKRQTDRIAMLTNLFKQAVVACGVITEGSR